MTWCPVGPTTIGLSSVMYYLDAALPAAIARRRS
jgi:hypothetical protein